MTVAIYIALIFLCASVSFLLSGMETGVFSLNRLRIRQQMRTGQAQAKILFNYYREPEQFFWTILVGNTLANAAIIIGPHGIPSRACSAISLAKKHCGFWKQSSRPMAAFSRPRHSPVL